MKRLLVRFISYFISDKQKRREFREKHDSFTRMKKEIQVLKQEINKIKEELDEISLYTNNDLVINAALQANYIKNCAEHLQNVEKLKENLDKTALENLETILKRIDKAEYQDRFLVTEIFSKAEINDWRKSKSILKEVKKIDDYYQYQNYKLPINYFEPAVFLYKHGLDKIKTLKELRDKVIIDAGAFVLDSALVFRDYTNNRIISFEPTKSTYELGLKTMELNNLQDITYENLALGDKTETSLVHIHDDCPGANRLICSEDKQQESCQTVTLDSYIEKHNLKVGLIKTDVEGFEPNLLEGALKTITEQKPILLISIYHNYNDFYKIKPYLESLNLGYKFDFFKGVDNRYCCDIMLIAEVY